MKKGHVLALVLLIPIFFCVNAVIRVQNVFDEMYYALSETSTLPLTLADYSDFSYVSSNNREIIDEFGRFHVYYDQSFEDTAYILLLGDINEKKISVCVQLAFDDYESTSGKSGYCIWLNYEYDVSNKTLFGLPLSVQESEYTHREGSFKMTREDARSFLDEHDIDIAKIEEWNQHYLHEKVLSDWFRYNGWQSRFSLNNLGNVKIVWDQW
jgi:hypothetical protein